MKRLLTILFLLTAFAGYSADRITATVTITNFPVTGNAINGRIWTNATTATTILTNLASINSATTNMFLHFAGTPLGSPNWILAYVSSNAISFEGQVGQAVAITLVGTSWASVTYETNSGPQSKTAIYPFSSIRYATNQTNQASSFVKGMSDHSTNSFSTNAVALSNHVSIGIGPGGGIQTIYGPKNFRSISGTNAGLTNGVIQGARMTNIVGLNGDVFALTNGQYISPTLRNPTSTNGANYGNAFSSPGAGTSSEQFGTGATGSGESALAVGASAFATGLGSVSVGAGGTAAGAYDTYVGASGALEGGGGVGLGFGVTISVTNGVAIGTLSSVTNAGSVAIGASATTTENNQIRLGASTYTVSVPGRIVAASSTNNTLTGTNTVGGDLSFDARANTSLANGNNAGVLLGTNVYVRLSGPSAAYVINGIAAERGGAYHICQFANPAGTVTIANESGTDPVAANRILTSTGADLVYTNNPVIVPFIYDGAASRWRPIIQRQ